MRFREGLSKEETFKLNSKKPVGVGQVKTVAGLSDRGKSRGQASEEVKHTHLEEQTVQHSCCSVPEG